MSKNAMKGLDLLFFSLSTMVNKNTLGAKKWLGYEKQQLKRVI